MHLYLFDDGYKLYTNFKIDADFKEEWVKEHGNIVDHKFLDNDG